ncbi:protein LURP-one-related 6 [Malania oleifera]|uniref:protein LURP-one-related 6 n=1 Tax=Malania oleifera TaxID=397392 RepID=UPI0025ADDD1F|nr:protein LURP-one-related 6 [Malania oleifera]
MATTIVSKAYCSSSPVVLTVRKRPHVVNGGGFVVTNCRQIPVFRVDGCGILGKKGELLVRDEKGDALLLIRQQQGGIQALSIHRQWKGYSLDYEGMQRKVFSLKEPHSCFARNHAIRICTEPRLCMGTDWDFEVRGSFPERACTIIHNNGSIVAQVGENKEMKMSSSKDVYHVVMSPGIDQAFVVGVIAVLDNIYHESTRC